MKKIKIILKDSSLIDNTFKIITENYSELSPNTEDGVRIDFEDAWVHMRKSNTEPIIRIFAEANSQNIADKYALKIENEIKSISS
jgi:phosphomannomutase